MSHSQWLAAAAVAWAVIAGREKSATAALLYAAGAAVFAALAVR